MKVKAKNTKKPNGNTSEARTFLNPEVYKSSSEIAKFIKNSKSPCVISLLQIENMATIMFTYGKKVRKLVEEGFDSQVKKLLPGIYFKRIDLDNILLIQPLHSRESFIKSMEKFTLKLGSFGTTDKETPVYFNTKIGSTITNETDNISDKLDEAFIALHECLSTARMNHILFDNLSEKLLEFQNEMKMAAFFQDALANKKLYLAYQPVINARTGKVKSYEVLLRIMCEDGKLISAGQYIQIAEKYGFIHKVDMFVLEMAINELKHSHDVVLGINVSNVSIDDGKWITKAKTLLTDSEVASRLVVEITETGVQESLERIISFVDLVKGFGCKMAIDDFGAGHTSFTQLKNIQADYLKIDGAFVKDIVSNPDSKLFVKTMIEFSKAFGLETIAEFVEDGAIAKVLIDLGVDYLQGYYFSKPLNYRPWIENDSVV